MIAIDLTRLAHAQRAEEFRAIARTLTPADLDVLVSSLDTPMVCGTGYRFEAKKLERRGLVTLVERFVPDSVYIARATDLGREFHAWFVDEARAAMARRIVGVA
jgi:hypothetical protein